MNCLICGHHEFQQHNVLWEQLVRDWELSPAETQTINQQQGLSCTRCHANLRSNALALAVLTALKLPPPFQLHPAHWQFPILEINPAGHLHQYLQQAPQLTSTTFPPTDIQQLPFHNQSFQLVLHSETLEHVHNPIQALRECLRVLHAGGCCCYTVPVLPSRLSRSRQGLTHSYHGTPQTNSNDLLVHTEFGADWWLYPITAGAASIQIVSTQLAAYAAIIRPA